MVILLSVIVRFKNVLGSMQCWRFKEEVYFKMWMFLFFRMIVHGYKSVYILFNIICYFLLTLLFCSNDAKQTSSLCMDVLLHNVFVLLCCVMDWVCLNCLIFDDWIGIVRATKYQKLRLISHSHWSPTMCVWLIQSYKLAAPSEDRWKLLLVCEGAQKEETTGNHNRDGK